MRTSRRAAATAAVSASAWFSAGFAPSDNSISPLNNMIPGATARFGGDVRARDRAIPVLVDEPRHGPPRHRDRRHHVVGVVPPSLRGGGVLILQAEHLARTFGRELERDPGAEEDVVAAGEVGLVGRPHVHPTLLRPPERLDVAQAAAAVLQVRFEAVRHLRLLVLPGDDQVAEGQQVAIGLRSPHIETGSHHLAGEFVVAGERPDGEHRRGRFEIGPRQLDLFLHTAHRMSELHAGVPDRIPDGRGQRLDLRPHLPGLEVVDEQEVEIAERSQLAPAVSADGEQRDPPPVGPVVGHGPIEDVDDPLVGHVTQSSAVGQSPHGAVGTGGVDLMLSPGVHRHRGRSTRSTRHVLAGRGSKMIVVSSPSLTKSCRRRRATPMGVF